MLMVLSNWQCSYIAMLSDNLLRCYLVVHIFHSTARFDYTGYLFSSLHLFMLFGCHFESSFFKDSRPFPPEKGRIGSQLV